VLDRLLGRRRSAPSRPVRLAARALAVGRIALGVVMVAAPGPTTRRWLGEVTEDDPGREIAVRGLGARDVVLGIGTLVAFRSGGEVRHAARWIEAGIVADLADAASTTLAEDLATSRGFPVTVALGAAATGAAIRTQLR
jgi:hypothetical protein